MKEEIKEVTIKHAKSILAGQKVNLPVVGTVRLSKSGTIEVPEEVAEMLVEEGSNWSYAEEEGEEPKVEKKKLKKSPKVLEKEEEGSGEGSGKDSEEEPEEESAKAPSGKEELIKSLTDNFEDEELLNIIIGAKVGNEKKVKKMNMNSEQLAEYIADWLTPAEIQSLFEGAESPEKGGK